ASILFLVIGVLVIWAMQTMLITAGDAVFVSLLLIPILVYVIFTDRLSEFKAPGGLEAKFVTMVKKPAEEMASENIELLGDDISVVTKGGPQELEVLESRLDESKRILLKLILGGHYDKGMLEEYVDRLLLYRTFRFVVFLDQKDRLVAYISASGMNRILKGPQGGHFVGLINHGNVPELWDFPGIMTRKLSTRENGINALKVLMENNLEAIILVDEADRLKGVLEREQILSKLLLAMAK
ncbi:MAG: hypothetical protein MN733_37495, partial [Nitrososphaera sp.]|nr:hypothetical protein [Nitrososphaera sp.]